MPGHGTEGNARHGLDEILSFVATGNALPVLHETAHALEKLLRTGEPTTIDLGAIPFAAGDERVMDDILGTGEVQARLALDGDSHVTETAIAGVWRIDHLDASGRTQSRFIEVTWIPEILRSQPQDAERGLTLLKSRLEAKAARPE